MIAIIDYGAGNLFSVKNALDFLEEESIITADCREIRCADAVILPGVGAFPDAMHMLREQGLAEVIKEEAQKKPLLGICLGMQMMFDKSCENGEYTGLGLMPGEIVLLPKDQIIPQIGWNRVDWKQSNAVNKGSKSGNYFYFVNSYYVVPDDDSIVMAVTDYNGEFVSMVSSGNIYASQFHIEKSGTAGLQLLKNFADLGEK